MSKIGGQPVQKRPLNVPTEKQPQKTAGKYAAMTQEGHIAALLETEAEAKRAPQRWCKFYPQSLKEQSAHLLLLAQLLTAFAEERETVDGALDDLDSFITAVLTRVQTQLKGNDPEQTRGWNQQKWRIWQQAQNYWHQSPGRFYVLTNFEMPSFRPSHIVVLNPGVQAKTFVGSTRNGVWSRWFVQMFLLQTARNLQSALSSKPTSVKVVGLKAWVLLSAAKILGADSDSDTPNSEAASIWSQDLMDIAWYLTEDNDAENNDDAPGGGHVNTQWEADGVARSYHWEGGLVIEKTKVREAARKLQALAEAAAAAVAQQVAVAL